LPDQRAASTSNFLELTLDRSRARLRPRQESIRRTTCKMEGWCSVVIGLHKKLALQLAWSGSWHRETGKVPSVEFSSFPNRPSCTCELPHAIGLPLSSFTFVAAFPQASSPSFSLYIFRARIVARQLTFAAPCFYQFATPPKPLGTTCLTKSSLTRNVTGVKR
jgi:hypothetical protein